MGRIFADINPRLNERAGVFIRSTRLIRVLSQKNYFFLKKHRNIATESG
jgi:hypothetical protein